MLIPMIPALFLTACSKPKVKELQKITVDYQCIHDWDRFVIRLRFHKTTSAIKEKELLNKALLKFNKPIIECKVRDRYPS